MLLKISLLRHRTPCISIYRSVGTKESLSGHAKQVSYKKRKKTVGPTHYLINKIKTLLSFRGHCVPYKRKEGRKTREVSSVVAMLGSNMETRSWARKLLHFFSLLSFVFLLILQSLYFFSEKFVCTVFSLFLVYNTPDWRLSYLLHLRDFLMLPRSRN